MVTSSPYLSRLSFSTQPAPLPAEPARMHRDPLLLYCLFLALQLAAGDITTERAAANLLELQHELGRRTPLSEGCGMLEA
jgi:hypothetical protein